MSVEPPPPDWVQGNAASPHRRYILDGEGATLTRSSPRIVLELVPRATTLDEAERSSTEGRQGPIDYRSGTATSIGTGIKDEIRRGWEDLAFTTLRRAQLVAFFGFVVVLVLTFHGWQRGIFSGMAADMSGELVMADGTPSAPRLSSDQAAWTEGVDEGRRSTASFASDRAFAGQPDDDEPTSGAKLFVTDGKKSSKRRSTDLSDGGSNGVTGERPPQSAETETGFTDTPDVGSTARKQTDVTTVPVRYENCSEAVAAGAAPIRLGQPGYRLSLDADKDGVACENGSTPEDPGDSPVDSLYSNQTTTTSSRDSGSTTTVSSTGAGTTSAPDSTTTSANATTETTTTGSTDSSGATSTTTTVTTSTTTSTTEAPTTTVSTTTATSTTSSSTTTTMSTTATTTTTSVSTTAPSTTTSPSTSDLPPVDPVRFG